MPPKQKGNYDPSSPCTPLAEQEFNATQRLVTLDPMHAFSALATCRSTETDMARHLLALLRLVAEGEDWNAAEVVYRVFETYAAGVVGRHCFTANVTRLDWWYEVGRAYAREHPESCNDAQG